MNTLLAVLAFVGVLLGLLLLIRNECVYRYRVALLDTIRDAANSDIDAGRSWVWRYKAYDAVGYCVMVLQFWRPLHSFYPDQRFLDPACSDPTREAA